MNLGLIFNQGDWVLITVFAILVLMSVVTWSIIVLRAVRLIQAKRANRIATASFWQARSLAEAQQQLADSDAPAALMVRDALAAKAKYGQKNSGHLADSVPLNEYLVRHIRNGMSQVLRQFEGGLSTLASIGATAPFIGLFGTVWGIYHALINISQSGQMSIAAVAGPIGEALIATAAGLFVAIPAVLAYNALVRGNKILAQDLDGFAHDLHVQLLHDQD